MEDYKKNLLRREYISRINKVQDYIEANLGEELSLKDLSSIANFSPYHFHRIYTAMTKEPLFQFIQRIRLEKAAFSLLANPGKPIVEIALEHGFSTHAAFAKAFKRHYKTSASQWRVNSDLYKPIKESTRREKGVMASNSLLVEIKDVPEQHVIYIRHTGPYKGDSDLFEVLFNRLFKWAKARDLVKFPGTKILTLYHDNPDLTDEERLRISVCLTVPKNIEVGGEIGKMSIPSGKYAIGHFLIKADQYQEAWNNLFADWLPESGFQPDDLPCYEHYLNNPKEHPEKKHLVDIYMAIKPL